MFLRSVRGGVVSRWEHGVGVFAHDNCSPHLGRPARAAVIKGEISTGDRFAK